MANEKQVTSSWVSENGEELTEDVLMKLYEVHEKERIAALDLHYRNRNYYMTLVSALLTIFVGGMLQFYQEFSSFILFAIPISIIVLSELAKRSMDRYYQRFLENIVILAKVEHLWGLDGSVRKTEHKSTEILWSEDKQFILDRWFRDRCKNQSSEQFVKERMSLGDNRYAHWVFSLIEVITIFLSLVSLLLLLQTHMNWSLLDKLLVLVHSFYQL